MTIIVLVFCAGLTIGICSFAYQHAIVYWSSQLQLGQPASLLPAAKWGAGIVATAAIVAYLIIGVGQADGTAPKHTTPVIIAAVVLAIGALVGYGIEFRWHQRSSRDRHS